MGKERPGGHVTKYGYDARDNLTRLEDNAGNVTTWFYNLESPQQTITKTYATGLTEVGNFNTNGTVSDFTDRMGRTTTCNDDAGNLLGDGTRVFEWDARNRLTAIQTGDHRSEPTRGFGGEMDNPQGWGKAPKERAESKRGSKRGGTPSRIFVAWGLGS